MTTTNQIDRVSDELPGILHVLRYGRILPTKPGTKRPSLRSVNKSATCSVEVVNTWRSEKPGCGWGCRISHPRLIVVDLEGEAKGDGLATIRKLVSRYGPLPEGPVVTTPRVGSISGLCCLTTHPR
jgi:hypothetical protein